MSMQDNNERNMNQNVENNIDEHISSSNALSDEQRVRVMSPGMLVFKRFIRNRLAVVGFVILAVMFTLSFVGPIFSAYDETQVFTEDTLTRKDFAGYMVNTDWSFTEAEGAKLSSSALTKAILFFNSGDYDPEAEENSYEAGDFKYIVEQLGESYYQITAPYGVAKVEQRGTNANITYTDSDLETLEGFEEALVEQLEPAKASGEKTTEFEFEEEIYVLVNKGTKLGLTTWEVSAYRETALATKKIVHFAQPEYSEVATSYDFMKASLMAYYGVGESTFTVDNKNFTSAASTTTDDLFEIKLNGEDYARITNYSINSRQQSTFLTFEFKDKLVDCIENDKTEFTMLEKVLVEVIDENEPGESDDAEGAIESADDEDVEQEAEYIEEEILYTIERRDMVFTVLADLPTRLASTYESPSGAHLLGTDKFGMDVSTRLMYGGRVSLMVGFIVVIIETLLGVLIGGIAGYFSGWVDVILMRFIELFNCIPFYPMLMIIGSLLDAARVSTTARIYWLMVVLGLLYWPGVARIVRGQILSLREQDFMVATEATGIPVHRRIIRHLVPNVIPLLIVQATMGLGSIIITEATLSFLGLGVKHPLASWGSIINQASNQYVMTNYWWVWLPAGLLILMTVLGFNFVGDGLRDAFDPKMKR